MTRNTSPIESDSESSGYDDAGLASTDEAIAHALDVTGQADDTVSHLTRELEESRKRELLAQAELENYRKRTQRDVEQTLKYASITLARELVEVLDNLVRACDSATGNSSAALLIEGVRMVQQQFLAVLEKHHCKRVEAVGKVFDPNVHQAIAQAPSDEHPAGIVMSEASAGYMMYDRVVRPSQVIVSTGSPSLTE